MTIAPAGEDPDVPGASPPNTTASPAPAPRARVRKRSISIAGHATSVSLEDPFWDALRDIAAARGCSVADLVRRVDTARAAAAAAGGGPPVNLSSALRVFVLDAVRGGAGTDTPGTR